MDEDRTYTMPLYANDTREKVSDIVFRVTRDNHDTTLTVVAGRLVGFKYEGVDFFYDMANLRKDLEKENLLLGCQGALINVFPGGLMGETTWGRIAYVFVDGKLASEPVNIYQPISPEEVPNLSFFDAQKEHRRQVIRGNRRV